MLRLEIEPGRARASGEAWPVQNSRKRLSKRIAILLLRSQNRSFLPSYLNNSRPYNGKCTGKIQKVDSISLRHQLAGTGGPSLIRQMILGRIEIIIAHEKIDRNHLFLVLLWIESYFHICCRTKTKQRNYYVLEKSFYAFKCSFLSIF